MSGIGLDRAGTQQPRGEETVYCCDHGRSACAGAKVRPAVVFYCEGRLNEDYFSCREQPTTGLGKKADLASRSVRIRKIPPGTEEGLLQQAIEKVATGIKRVEIFQDLWEAVVEFETIAVRDSRLNV